MGLLKPILWVLLVGLIANVDAKKSRRLLRNQLPSPDDCANVQSFEHLYKYTYSYDAIATTKNLKLDPIQSGIRIKCDKLVISVPNNCVAVLKVSECSTFQGTQSSGGSIEYNTPSDGSILLNKLMKKNPTYFQFNQGAIGKVFIDQAEPTDIANIKRAMLSALQLQYKQGSKLLHSPISKRVKVQEVSIFGAGEIDQYVTSYRDSYPREINTERNMTKLQLPWSRVHSSYLHTPSDKVADALVALGVKEVQSKMDEATQACRYILERGRRITEASCTETRNVMFPRNTFLQPVFGDVRNNRLSTAEVKLNVKSIGMEKMGESDVLRPNEMKQFRVGFKPDSLMFEEQWQKANSAEIMAFDVMTAIGKLVTQQPDQLSPVLFMKIARHLSQAPLDEVNQIWTTISSRFIGLDLEKATTLWVQLLHQCTSANYLCYSPICVPNVACQTGLASFISTTGMHTWSQQVKTGVLEALSSIEEPNILIVRSTLGICRAQTELRTVLALGKVLANHIATCEEDSEESVVVDALQFMKEQLNTDCSIQQGKPEHESIMVAVMNMLSVIHEETTSFTDTVVACATNTQVPKSVSLAAIRSLKNMPISNNAQVRRRVLSIFSDSSRPSELRIACYLLLMTKEPSQSEINTMVQAAADSSQPRSLRFFIKENIKSQIQLRQTTYCRLSDTTMTRLTDALGRYHLDLGFNWRDSAIREQPYEMERKIFVPYLEREVTCHFKSNLIFSKNSAIPILVNVSVVAEIMSQNVTILETTLDVGGILSSVEPLFGANGIFPDRGLQQFLQLPAVSFVDSKRWWPVSASEANVLESIQDEASMAYTILSMQNKSPIQIKLFNTTIDIPAILRNVDIRNINIMDLVKIFSTLEDGRTISDIMDSQILFGATAKPTSTGAPNIIQHEISYYHDIKMNLVAQMKQLFFTGQGQISVAMNPNIRVASRISSLIELPQGVKCGAGYQVSAGHGSNFNASMVATATNVKFNLSPLPRKTELFTAKVGVMTARSGIFEVVESLPACQPQCLVGNCQSGVGISYKSCVAPLDVGLFIDSNAENYFETELSWGAMQLMKERVALPCNGLELKLNKKLSPTAANTPIFRCSLKYISTSQELVADWQLAPMTSQPWTLRANAMTNRNAEQLVGFFASLNVTRPDGSLAARNYVNIAKLNRQPEAWVEEIMELFSRHSEAEVSPRYTITSEIKLPLVGDICTTGMLEIPRSPGYKAHLVMKQGVLADASAKKLLQFNVTSLPTTDDDYQGYITKLIVENLSVNSLPYSSVKFNFYSAKDQQTSKARNSIHYEVVPRSGQPFFVNWNTQHMKLQTSSNIPFVFNSTLTSNSVQLQMDIHCANYSHISAENHIHFPIKPILSSQMMDKRAVRIGKDIDLQSKMFALYMKVYRDINGDVFYAISTNVISKKPYTCMSSDTTTYGLMLALRSSLCPYCYEAMLNIPYVMVNSHWKQNDDLFDHKLSVDLHQSAFTYFNLPSMFYSSAADRYRLGYIAKYTKINDMTKEFELGYSFADSSFRILATETNIFRSDVPRLLNILVFCDSCLPMTTFNTNLTISSNNQVNPIIEVPPSTENSEVIVSLNHSFVNGPEFDLVCRVFTSIADNQIIDLRTSLSAKYPRKRFTYSYFVAPTYDYLISFNTTLQNVPTYVSDRRRDYSASIDCYVGDVLSQYQGTISVGRDDPICPTKEDCNAVKVDISKVSSCGPSSAKCVQLQINLIGTPAVFSNTVLITGKDDVTTPINVLDLRISRDSTSKKASLNIDLSEDQLLIPRFVQANYTDESGIVSANFALKGAELDWRYTHATQEGILRVSTNLDILSLDCSASLSMRDNIALNIPTCTITQPSLPNGKVIAQSSWNWRSVMDNDLSLLLRTDVATLVDMKYRRNNNAYTLRYDCGVVEDPSSPCSFHVDVNYPRVQVKSHVNSPMFTHTAVADLSYTSLLGSSFSTNNTAVYFGNPLVFATNFAYPQIGELSWDLNANAPRVFTKAIHIRNSQFKSILMQSLRPVYIPIYADYSEWLFRYTLLNEGQHDFVWNLSIGHDTALASAFYLGPNSPDASVYESSVPSTAQIFHTLFNLTRCSSNVLFHMKNIRSGRFATDLLKSEMNVNINVWPFVSDVSLSRYLGGLIPTFVTCPMCLGEISVSYEYDNLDTRSTSLVANAIHAQTRQIAVQYTITIDPTTDETSVLCQTELSWLHAIADVTPKITNKLNYVTRPSGSYMIKERLTTQGMPRNRLEISEDITIDASEISHNLKVIRNDASFENVLMWNAETKKVMLRFPDRTNPTVAIDVTVQGEDFDIGNCTVLLPFSHSRITIERAHFSILRNTLNQISGVRMTNLKLTAMNTITMEPTLIIGKGQVMLGGTCNLNIRDTENRYIRLVMSLEPGAPSTANSDIMLNLQMIRLTVKSLGTFSPRSVVNNFNISLELPHSISRKMMPVCSLNNEMTVTIDDREMYNGRWVIDSDIQFPWMYSTPMKYSHLISVQPTTDRTGRSITAIINWQRQQVVSLLSKISNECAIQIPVMSGMTACVPRSITANGKVDLPMWSSNIDMTVNDNRVFSNFTVALMMWNSPTARRTTIWEFKELVDLQRTTAQSMFMGQWTDEIYTRWPMEGACKSNLTFAPAGTDRTIIYSWSMGNMDPIRIQVAPQSGNPSVRSITVQALRRDILTSTLETSSCLDMPDILSWLCIPSHFAMRQINADIPTVGLLRIVPLMRIVLPDTSALDITLRDSTFDCTITMETAHISLTSNAVLNSPALTQPLNVRSTMRLGPNEWFCSTTSNMWNGNFMVTINPTTTSVTCAANIDAPWLLANITYMSPRILRVTECAVMLKTKGKLATFIPININLDYRNNPETSDWNINFRSCVFPFLMGTTNNVSLSIDNLMRDMYFHWDTTSETFDLLNQLIDLRLQKTRDWNLLAGVSNIFFWAKMSSLITRNQIITRELMFGLPSQSSGIQFSTSDSGNVNERFIIKWSDDKNQNYLCRVSTLDSTYSTLVFNCFRIQERTAHTFIRELPIANFRIDTRFLLGFQAPPSYWINLLTNLRTFNFYNLFDETWVKEQCVAKFHVTEPALCLTLSQYWKREVTKFVENPIWNLDSMMCFIDRLRMYTPVRNFYNHVFYSNPYIQHAVMYNTMLQDTVMSWTSGMLTCGVVNTTDQIALQCNVTCASCGPMTVNVGLVMTSDAEGNPIANLTTTTPFMSSHFMFYYGFPVRPVTFAMRTNNNEVSANINWDYPAETGFNSLTATWSLMDKGIQCTCPKDTTVFLGMSCTCHSTTGPKTLQEIPLSDVMENLVSLLTSQTIQTYSTKDQINKYFTNGPLKSYLLSWSQDLFTYFESILHRYTRKTPAVSGIHIPIWRWSCDQGALSLFADVDISSLGLIIDFTSNMYPDLNQEMRMDVKNTEAGVFGHTMLKNNFFWMTSDYETNNLAFIGSSFGLPDSHNCVNMTRTPEGLRVQFMDVEGSAYICMLTSASTSTTRVKCDVTTHGSTTTTPVSDTIFRNWWMNPQETMMRIPMSILETYALAINPPLFKKHLRKTLDVTNMHSLDVVCDFMSEKCLEMVNHFHKNYLSNKIDLITDYLQLNIVNAEIVKKIFSLPELVEYLIGESSLNDILRRNAEDVVETVLDYCRRIYNQFNEIYRIVKPMNTLQWSYPSIPYVEVNLRNIITWLANSIEKCNNVLFMSSELICKPNLITPQLYVDVNYQDVFYSIINILRPQENVSRAYEISPLHHNQIINFQQDYYEFPVFKSDDCIRLAAMDVVDNQFAFLVKPKAGIVALPRERVAVEFNLNRNVYLLTSDGSRNAIELPYFSDVLDIQVSRKQIHCRTSGVVVSLTYSEQEPASFMQEIRVQRPYSQFVAGGMGSYSSLFTLPSRMIPDGSQATDLPQFANSYEISRLPQCIIALKDIPDHSSTPKYCEQIFSTAPMRKVAERYPDLTNSYKRACSEACTRQEETCWFTRTFAAQLRSMGYPMNITSNCLLCNHEYTPVVSNEIYILMSLSKEMQDIYPVKLLNKMIFKALKSINENVHQETKIGIVTYGGKGSLYKPMMTTIDSRTLSSDIDQLKSKVKLMEFNGPYYTKSSTYFALNYMHTQMIKAPRSMSKSLVLFTPEPEELSCDSLDFHVVKSLNEELTSVLLWSPVVRENDNNIILRTQDVCKTKYGGPSRVADLLSEHVASKSSSNVRCHCYITNNYTGAVKSKCVRR